MSESDGLKLFHLNHSLLRLDLESVERTHGLDLGLRRAATKEREDSYYLQFPALTRGQAEEMAQYYTLFFCLENDIRDMVTERLIAQFGPEWWSEAVPPAVRENAKKSIDREKEAGVTPRSPDMIDYTNFGELGEIIFHNWDVFGDTFSNRKALQKVLTSLNVLRGPIAHCSPLAADEQLRLQLALRDWFRAME